MQRVTACLLLLLLTIPVGLAVRYAPLHLPWFWSKYLGSAFWAVALYWFVAMLLPRLRPVALACIAGIAATLVELSRLVPEPHVDAFRLTLAGKLLLGRYFSIKNIVVYLLAIALTAAADSAWCFGASNRQAN
ncbi:ribosomal maturation YjgA family protein [Terriglobus tenax]|uniref:ribosomal maturation YjgA family protein n=1 Tax=Terriglobus tenax TaxID=1111115 RepID=UPI0021E04C9F|nr:DUF2809 domain-containing protein [Terriglobus tenax]